MILFLTLFAGAAVGFGLWLRPKWRRAVEARLRRRDTMILSRGRELWLWLNTFGSIALGAVLFTVVGVETYGQLRERAQKEELARFAFACDQQQLTVVNRGEQPRRIRVAAPELEISSGRLMETPERWKARFDGDTERPIGPGETVRFAVQMTPGHCARPSVQFIFDAPEMCDLAFDFASESVETRLQCRIK